MKATDYASDSSFPPIPASAAEGEQGHVVGHNEFRDVFAYVAAHPPKRFNAATGGTVTDVEDYNGTGQRWRVHTFTGSGTFTVTTADQPFRALVLGSGGRGGIQYIYEVGGGGDGGYNGGTDQAQIPVGAYPVTVGGGNSADSLLGDLFIGKGGKGGPNAASGGGAPYSRGNGKTNGPQNYDITGTPKDYGKGGPHGDCASGVPTPPPNTGDGGGGGCDSGGGRTGGASGIVIVAYQIG